MDNYQKKKVKSEQIIPREYLALLKEFMEQKKYGTISLILQKGEIVGCDVLEKRRDL